MRWIVLAAVVLVARFAAFVIFERSAAPMFSANANSGETPTRHVSGGRYWRRPDVNKACRNICEPHCASRWGTTDWAYVLREGCYLNCVDVACKAQ
jgi:hypothetical protein